MGWNESDVNSLVHIITKDALADFSVQRHLNSGAIDVCTHRSIESFLGIESDELAESCVILCVTKSEHRMPHFYEQLGALSTRFPTILITDDHEIRSAVECMKAGASDYLVKPCDSQEVMVAVKAALKIDHPRRAKEINAAKALESFKLLSSRERVVMGLVTTGLLNKQVAFSLGITEGTIKWHRAKVMSKMNVKTLPSLVRLADLIALQPDGRLSSENEIGHLSL